MKKCSCCEEIKDDIEFSFRKDRNKLHSYCKRCSKENNNIFYQKTQKGRFGRYKKSAIERNINFNITFEEFIEFWNKPCLFCGSPIETIGLDRINNELGYTYGNLVPCCTTCNKTKNDLSFEKWLEYIEQVKEFLNSGKIKVDIFGNIRDPKNFNSI